MKQTRIDKLGRIVIPINYRKKLNITENTDIQISFFEDCINIKPVKISCKLCNCNIEPMSPVPICDKCIKKIKSLP